MPYKDIEARRAASKRHYEANREKMIARAKQHRKKTAKEMHKFLLEHLRSNPCVDCGERDPVVLEFDHAGEKNFNIGEFVRLCVGWDRLTAEIAKCHIRCANCHRRKTYKERGHSHRG